MTINDLTKLIAKIEGKKKQVHMGNVREIISILSDILYKHTSLGSNDVCMLLYKNGKRRSKLSLKKKA